MQRVVFMAVVAFLGTAGAGCAGHIPPPAQHVQASDPGASGPVDMSRPIVIEFQPGDVIPLTMTVGGVLVATPEDLAAIPLRVIRHFYLRVDPSGGLETSLDGVHFGKRPVERGSFKFGVGITHEGVRATFAIRTPTPVEPVPGNP